MLSLSTHSFHFIYPPGLAHGPIRQGGRIRQRPSSGKLLTMGNFKKRLVSKFRPCGPNPAPEPPCSHRGPKPATKTHQVHAQPQPAPKEETATESRPRPPTLHLPPHAYPAPPNRLPCTSHPPTRHPETKRGQVPPSPPTRHLHPHAYPAPPDRLPCTRPAVSFPGQYYHLRTKVGVSEWHRERTAWIRTVVLHTRFPFSFPLLVPVEY